MFQRNMKISRPHDRLQACFDGKTPLALRVKRWFAFGA
jgi:hypothetical protein